MNCKSSTSAVPKCALTTQAAPQPRASAGSGCPHSVRVSDTCHHRSSSI